MFSSTHTQRTLTKLLLCLCVFGVFVTVGLVFPDIAEASHCADGGGHRPGGGETPCPEEDSSLFEVGGVEGFIYSIAVGFGGIMLWLGGSLLDYAIAETVVGMGDMLRGGVGVAVDTMWVVVRDVFNIIFIFGLIYIGFRTILKSDDAGTKRAVALLIVAALLINFSLFITKAVVDFSNLMAHQIHNVIISDDTDVDVGSVDPGTAESVSARQQELNEGSISNTFMNYFRLTTYAQSDVLEQLQAETYFHGGRLIFYGLLMMLVMLIAAFVFAAGAFMLIARFVALIIFMILSPAMFLGFIFPLFEKYQTMWWDKFLKYAFVGPAYLFMIYLSLWTIAGLGSSGSFAQGFSAAAWQQGFFIIFLNFFIIAGFLIASLILANQLGVYGAAGAVNILNNAKNRVTGYAKNTSRRIAARGYNAARAPDRAVRRAAVGGVSNAALKGYNKWQTKNERGALGKFMSEFRLDRSVRNTLEKGRQYSAGLKHSYADNQAYDEQVLRRQQRKADEDKAVEEFNKYRESLRATGADPEDMPMPAELKDALNNVGKKVRDMSQKEIEASGMDFLSQDHVVLNLTSNQIDQIEKSEKFSQTEVNELKDKRKAAFLQAAEGDRSTLAGVLGPQFITDMKPNEMAKLPADVLLHDNVVKKIPTAALARIAQDRTLRAEEERRLRQKLEKQKSINIDEEAEKMREAERKKSKSAFGKAKPDLDKVEKDVQAMRDRAESLGKWFDTPVAHGFGV